MAHMLYRYGAHGKFSHLGQPLSGLLKWEEDPSGKYGFVLVYSRSLSEEETAEYGLEFISKEKWFR